MSAQVPPGVNLKDDLGGAIIRPAVAVIVVVALFVAARLASRKLKKADWNASELFVIFGFLGCLVFAALDVYGKHKVRRDTESNIHNAFADIVSRCKARPR